MITGANKHETTQPRYADISIARGEKREEGDGKIKKTRPTRISRVWDINNLR